MRIRAAYVPKKRNILIADAFHAVLKKYLSRPDDGKHDDMTALINSGSANNAKTVGERRDGKDDHQLNESEKEKSNDEKNGLFKIGGPGSTL